VRQKAGSPIVFERYQRSEKALVSVLTEMCVQEVSTRKVKEITEELCGHEFSAATISRMTSQLDEERVIAVGC
jgi:transposase-like protein